MAVVRMWHPKSEEELIVPEGAVERYRKLGFTVKAKPPPKSKSKSKSEPAPDSGASSTPEKKEG